MRSSQDLIAPLSERRLKQGILTAGILFIVASGCCLIGRELRETRADTAEHIVSVIALPVHVRLYSRLARPVGAGDWSSAKTAARTSFAPALRKAGFRIVCSLHETGGCLAGHGTSVVADAAPTALSELLSTLVDRVPALREEGALPAADGLVAVEILGEFDVPIHMAFGVFGTGTTVRGPSLRVQLTFLSLRTRTLAWNGDVLREEDDPRSDSDVGCVVRALARRAAHTLLGP